MLRYSLVLFLLLAGGIAALFSPALASCLYLWHDIFRPLEFARHAGAVPAAPYVFILLFVSYFMSWARGAIRPRRNAFVIGLSVMILWMVITMIASPYKREAWDGLVLMAKYLLPLLMVSTCLRSRRDVLMVVAIIALSVGIWSAQAGLHALMRGETTRNMFIPGSQMSDNNDFMAATVSITPLVVFFGAWYKWKFHLFVKIGIGLLVALFVSAIIFSSSRGAALGLASTAMLYVILVSKQKLRDGVALGVLFAIALALAPESFFERMKTIELSAEQTEASAVIRTKLMKAAWQCTLDHPVFGRGPYCWIVESGNYYPGGGEPHCSWLKLSAEFGFPGVIIYFTIIGVILRGLFRVRERALRSGDKTASGLAVALIMSIAGFLVPLTFLSHPFGEFLWAQLAVASGFAVLYPEEQCQTNSEDGAQQNSSDTASTESA